MVQNTSRFWNCVDTNCSGSMIYDSHSWECQDTTCTGHMEQETTPPENWICVDSTCNGTNAMIFENQAWTCFSASCGGTMQYINMAWTCVDNSSVKYIIAGAVAVVIVVVAYMFIRRSIRRKKMLDEVTEMPDTTQAFPIEKIMVNNQL